MKKLFLTALIVTTAAAAFAQGAFMEYKTTMDMGNGKATTGSMKTYYQDGNSRTETTMNMPEMPNMPARPFSMVSLMLSSKPRVVYQLNEKDKTYSETLLNGDHNEWLDRPENEYEVTLVGTEQVNGYSTKHVIIKYKTADGKRESEQEMWTTTAIEKYAFYANVHTEYMGKNNLNKALAAKGAEGFPVRVKSEKNGHLFQMDLVKTERKALAASLFSLDGYTKTTTPTYGGMQGGVDYQKMIKDMQNMTPEQRKKMMEDMQKPK